MAFALPLLGALAAGGGAAAAGGSVATAVGLAGTAFSGLSAYSQAKYQASVASNNQIVAVQNATAESTAAQQKQVKSDQQYRQLIGEQTAIQSASGLDILGDSQLRTRQLSENVRGQDAQNIRDQGAVQVGASMNQAANFGYQRDAANSAAFNALASMTLGMGNTALKDPSLKKSLAGGATAVRNFL
jgi:hypothetical protein